MLPKEFQARLQVPKDSHQAPIPLLLGRFVSTLFLLFCCNLTKKMGPNCTKIWELSPKKCSQVPQGKQRINSCSSKRIVFFEQVGLESGVKLHVPTPFSSPNGFLITFNWKSHMNKIMTIKKNWTRDLRHIFSFLDKILKFFIQGNHPNRIIIVRKKI